ncbi:MAG TPA: hypothetical protein VJJ75_02685 [Candidatus Nanoarchaeia archaeon]|nr:hypothetical protein [Candidatus Nanoarchaeia archaeon]
MEKTTIQVNQTTLERLKQLKRYEQQTYDETLNVIFDEMEEENLTSEEIEEIQQGLEDVKKGRIKPIQQVAKELGIKLH